MNDIDNMPAKCRDCPYWEIARKPYNCDDCEGELNGTLNQNDIRLKAQFAMKKFECLVKRDGTTKKLIRYFSDSEHAFVWLELEGYKVFYVKEVL